jgi:uncharacterized protein YjbI with pentapeptide repeats
MQFDSESFKATGGNGPEWAEHFYRYCDFVGISTDGAMVHAFFLGSEFSRCDWYWGHFSQAVFVKVKFSGCKFRGCFFADCKFVECEFEDCSFTTDNLGSDCTFKENRWFDCQQTNCTGIENAFKNSL